MILGFGRPWKEPGKIEDFLGTYLPTRLMKRLYRAKAVTTKKCINQHQCVLGASGLGKSRLDFSVFTQLVAQGYGVLQIDTHADLFLNELSFLAQHNIPPKRVVLIDPCHRYRELGSPSIDFLEKLPGIEGHEVVEDLVSALLEISEQSRGFRQADVARMTFLALYEGEYTFADSLRFLSSVAFRAEVLARVSNPEVRTYWTEHFAGLKPYEQKLIVESTRNKLSPFVTNPYIRPMIARKGSTISFSECMQQGKIVLVNLSRDHLKEETRALFGKLLLAKLNTEILQRQRIPEHARRPFHILCDEVGEYYNAASLLNMLTASRKYNCGVSLYLQSLAQLPDKDVDIILGNCGVLACMGVGRNDALRMALEMFRFTGTRAKEWKDKKSKATPRLYSIQEEYEHAITLLMDQERQEISIKVKPNPNVWLARVPDIEYPPHDEAKVEALREASAAIYARRPVAEEAPYAPPVPEAEPLHEESEDLDDFDLWHERKPVL